MAAQSVQEQIILQELHRVPPQHWGQVLTFIRSLQPRGQDSTSEKQTLLTAADLLQSGLVGMWADRTDISDSREFARRLREEAQTRRRDA